MSIVTRYTTFIEGLSAKTPSDALEALERLIALMKRRGHEHLLPRIYARLTRASARRSERELAVARKEDAPEAKKELGITDDVRAVVIPELIGGWRYRDGAHLRDASHKRALLELFRKIT